MTAQDEPVRKIRTPIRLDYTITAGEAPSRFLRGLTQRKILGQRCPQCEKVYVPPRGACPGCGVPTREDVELADTGTITTFCIVNIPVIGRSIELPYVAASVALDGADISIYALVQECAPEAVRMGMRVEAVWKPDGERQGSHEDIVHFRPTGEPDAPLASFMHRL